MCARILKVLVFAACFCPVLAAPGFAQAILSVGSASTTAADIGYTELTGPITLTVSSGTSAAAPMVIAYSAPITNNDAAEIKLAGPLAGTGVVLDKSDNSVWISIPQGGKVGDYVIISGVRVATAGLKASSVSATLYSPSPTGNSVLAGQTNPVVINNIMQPFSVDQSETPPLSYSNGMITNGSTTFTIKEAYATAFEGSTGTAGRIRIHPFPAIPEGVHITFNPVARSAETGAVFTTVSGEAETIPRDSGSTDVFFQFNPAYDSANITESFEFSASITVDTTGSGIFQFQAELQPIGRAVPTGDFPSTAIPRYAERLVPDETDLIAGSTELVFPFRIESDHTYTGIALTNPLKYRVQVTLTAYNANGDVIAGTGITNPVDIELPEAGQYAKLASEIFGAGFNKSSAGTIRVVGRTPSMQGFYLVGDESGPKLDGSTGDIRELLSWYIPIVFRQGTAPFNLLELFNRGESESSVTLQLFDMNGVEVASRQLTIGAGSTLLREIGQLFGVALSSYQGGYIKGSADFPLIVRGNFGNAIESNIIPAQTALSLVSFSIPHFATGNQYTTELNILNGDRSQVAKIQLTLLNNSGQPISSPAALSINPGAQLIKSVASLFPDLGPGLVTGSIKVDVASTHQGPFVSVPPLTGSVRFANVDGSASATLPLVTTPASNFVYSHVAQSQGWFTGVAILNANPVVANVTLEVFDKDGIQVGSYSTQLQPGERFAKLVKELAPKSAGQLGGFVRVTSNVAVTSFSLFGTDDLRSLSAIPPQIVK